MHRRTDDHRADRPDRVAFTEETEAYDRAAGFCNNPMDPRVIDQGADPTCGSLHRWIVRRERVSLVHNAKALVGNAATCLAVGACCWTNRDVHRLASVYSYSGSPCYSSCPS